MSSKWWKPCERGKLKKGPWTFEEDIRLLRYIKLHGPSRWNALAKASGLQRCGKSCRLRWVNYLRPDLKRGSITPEEEHLILELHARLGNRWSLIAENIPGRTDNEIKNFWRSRIRKRIHGHGSVLTLPNISSLPLVTISTSMANQTQPLSPLPEPHKTGRAFPPNVVVSEPFTSLNANLHQQRSETHGGISNEVDTLSAGLKWEEDEVYYSCSCPEQDSLTEILYQLYSGIHDISASTAIGTNVTTTAAYSCEQSGICLDLDDAGMLWNTCPLLQDEPTPEILNCSKDAY